MEMNDFIGNLRDQFDDLDESIVLTPEMSFRDIDGYSSLVALLIISMFDEEYGVTVLNAISNWEGGLRGIGQGNEGIVLFKLDKNGVVNSYVVHSIDRQIDAVRLQELTDGRTALILTLSSASSNRDVTQETKYMIVTDDIFQ